MRRAERRIVMWLLLLTSFASLWLVHPAQAATTTGTLTVQMTITASCTVTAATVDFGTSTGTALLSAAVNATGTVSVTCTNGSAYSIGMDNGAHASSSQRRMANGSNFINYNLYTDSGRLNAWTTASSSTTCTTASSCVTGTGTGSAQSTTIYGTVPAVAVAPAAGSYSDSVTMTVTY